MFKLLITNTFLLVISKTIFLQSVEKEMIYGHSKLIDLERDRKNDLIDVICCPRDNKRKI